MPKTKKLEKIKLSNIPNSYEREIQGRKVLLLKDSDGHHAIIFRSMQRLALQFQNDYVPIVMPEMEYEVVGLVDTLEGLKALE